MYPVSTLPTGTLTFAFTNVEFRLNSQEDEVEALLARHDVLLRQAVEANGGHLYKIVRHASQAAFPTAPQAVAAAIAAQRASSELLGDAGGVRIALHTGVTQERDGGDYFGPILNRISRMLAASHGGQIIVSQATEELLRDSLPPDVSLRDLGEHLLRDLANYERIYQLVAPGLQSDFPPLKTMEARANNLPVQPTPLVGRASEVAECRALLLRDDVWLVTMTGPGGIGKSRLAIHLAAEMLDDFADGAFFVPLAPISDPDLLIPTICQALDVREVRGLSLLDTLHEYLRDKQMLLLLDNFEQVVAAAPVVTDLLDAAPRLKIVVTSRMSLRVRGEKEYSVPPLHLPDVRHLPTSEKVSQYDAVALFIERAVAVKPDFQVTNDNAPAVAEICVRLDGLPLAIELAAARVKLLSLDAILDRLDNRMKLLTGRARDVPPRHQTLRATIDWSFDLLDPAEKLLFSSLSVFAGCSFEAAEALWELRITNYELRIADDQGRGGPPGADVPYLDVLDGLWSLVDKNLLRRQEWEGDEPRFFMLQTIREYGLERLATEAGVENVRRWHASYFLDLAERAEIELTGQRQSYWLGLLELEHENLRAAMRWALENGEANFGLRLAGALWRFWYIRGHFSEGLDWLQRVLNMPQPPEQSSLYARALNGAGNMSYSRGDYALARSLHEKSLAISEALGDTKMSAPSHNNLGHLARRRGEYDAARSYLEEARRLSRQLGNKTLEATSLNNLGLVAYDQGDYVEARRLQEASLDIFSSVGDTWGTAMALGDLGKVVFEQGDYDGAEELYKRSLDLQEQLGDRIGIAATLLSRGKAAHNRSDYPTAHSLYSKSLAAFRELGDKRGIADALHGLGKVAFRHADYETARSKFEESLRIRQELGDRRYIAESLNNLGLVQLSKGHYSKAKTQLASSLALWRELGSKARIPTALNNLALVAILRHDYSKAHDYLNESKALFEASGKKAGVGFAFLNSGLAYMGQERYSDAASSYKESLRIFHRLGDRLHTAICLVRMAVLHATAEEPSLMEFAALLSGAAESILEALGAPLPAFEHEFYDPAISKIRSALGETQFLAARAKGSAMPLEDVIESALAGAVESIGSR